MKRWEAVALLARRVEESLVIACNGMIGRDLWNTGDRENRFYMIGSMGLASSIGLGLALAQPQKRVVVLDGDGNVLMNMGTLANVAAAQPRNFYHVVLDNGVHASTGGQTTVSGSLALEEVARACGYARVARAESSAELESAVEVFLAGPGPACLLVKVEPGNQPGVPRIGIAPEEMAARFQEAATGGGS